MATRRAQQVSQVLDGACRGAQAEVDAFAGSDPTPGAEITPRGRRITSCSDMPQVGLGGGTVGHTAHRSE